MLHLHLAGCLLVDQLEEVDPLVAAVDSRIRAEAPCLKQDSPPSTLTGEPQLPGARRCLQLGPAET